MQCICTDTYMPYPPQHPRALSLPSVDYSVPSPSKSAHEQKQQQKGSYTALSCTVQKICICSSHVCAYAACMAAYLYLAFCSHDLHISFPEGIMTDGHLGAPPAGPTDSCRQ